MPIYNDPVAVPSQSNVNEPVPGHLKFKFIPNPNNPAELRLRALKDKRNERENLRRMRKRATEEAATVKAASNSE